MASSDSLRRNTCVRGGQLKFVPLLNRAVFPRIRGNCLVNNNILSVVNPLRRPVGFISLIRFIYALSMLYLCFIMGVRPFRQEVLFVQKTANAAYLAFLFCQLSSRLCLGSFLHEPLTLTIFLFVETGTGAFETKANACCKYLLFAFFKR